jgi:hypothetical protein
VGTRVQPAIEAVNGLAKLKRWLLIGATVLHLAAMVGSGSPRAVRTAAQKLFRPYTSGLRMGSSWEMFIRPPQDSIVEIVGVKRSGEEITLETANATNKSWLSRVRDARQRKILSTLSSPPQLFRIGRAILMHACREAGSLDVVEVRAVIVHARKLRPDGNVPLQRSLARCRRDSGGGARRSVSDSETSAHATSAKPSALARFFHTPTDGSAAALFRVFLGLIAGWQSLGIWLNLERYWGPSGMIPFEFVSRDPFIRVSVLAWAPESFALLQLVAALFSLAALALLLGLQPRIAATSEPVHSQRGRSTVRDCAGAGDADAAREPLQFRRLAARQTRARCAQRYSVGAAAGWAADRVGLPRVSDREARLRPVAGRGGAA